MKRCIFLILLMFDMAGLHAGSVEKTFYFTNYTIQHRGPWQTVNFGNTVLSGMPGEPLLPWHEIVLMLPPGEVAESINLTEEDETAVTGPILLFPKQSARPTSDDTPAKFIMNDAIYKQKGVYPAQRTGHLLMQYLNGVGFALCTFTPVKYHPDGRTMSYFKKVTVKIETRSDTRSSSSLANLPQDAATLARVKNFAMNPEILSLYPIRKSPVTGYQYLIIAPASFKNEFQPLTGMYALQGITTRVITTDSIAATMTGFDLQEKIRNFIILQHQDFGVGYVLLAGNPPLVPARGFYCYVISGGGYSDSNIPSDLYYAGIDGNYDANGNHIYAEVNDNPDLLPDLSVGRFTVNDTAELHHMIRKTVSYQTNPVLGEFNNPLLAGEWLYNTPLTYGGNYMNLLVNNRNDNGYFTHGIPSVSNSVEKLYDTLSWQWSASLLLASINRGHSFIHHLGHANTGTMMRLYTSNITNANFSQVNGITHNYQILYTQGCYCGAFDAGCIAAKTVTIDNFLVAGIFNSRYGWFDEGTTEGPSEHLEREFVSALYTDTVPEKHLGTAHVISKIKTAPWISLPGEFEPGAQRWCQYTCNVFGDPALEIRTGEPSSFTTITWTGNLDSDWNKAGNWNLARVPTTLNDVVIPDTPHDPVITTINATFCHNLTIQNGGNLTINPGKSMVVYGTVSMSGE